MKKFLLNLIIFTIIFFNFKPNCSQTQTLTANINSEKTYNNIYYEKFKDLLLVINFNHPHYQNIPFLKKLYSPIFKNIVFYGEKKNKDIFTAYSHYGSYYSNILQDVLTRFPQYKGYLILQDDCGLNFWNCLSLDQDKIWYSLKFNGYPEPNIIQINSAKNVSGNFWPGWEQIYEGLNRLKETQLAYANLTSEDLNILQKNLEIENVATYYCDFFYFPSRLSKSIIKLSKAFKNVFCEIAIPNMLCCLDNIQNWENLDILWGVNPITSITDYPIDPHWIHPVKFSNSNNRAIVSEIFNKMLLEQN